jgi:hypothetical protein
MNTIDLNQHLEEEDVKVKEEIDTKPSKSNYCILKDMKRYIFHFLYIKARMGS